MLLRTAAVLAILFISTAAVATPDFGVRTGSGPPGGGGGGGQGPPFDVPPLGPNAFTLGGFPGGGPGAFSATKQDHGVGDCRGPTGPPAPCIELDIIILADPDPSLTIVLAATNLTASTQSFVFEIFLPISPLLGGTVISSGSVQGTLTDSLSDGATFTSPAVPNNLLEPDVYTALYNPSGGGSGRQVASGLFLDLFTFSVPSGQSGAPFPAGSFGPQADTVGTTIGDLNEIGIRVQFDLTPFDVVAFTGNFFVIPEPGTAALLLTGLFLVGLRRRVR